MKKRLLFRFSQINIISLILFSSNALSCEKPQVVEDEYDSLTCLRYGSAWAQREGMYGLIDKTGKVIAPFRYGDFDSLAGSLNIVFNDKRTRKGVVDRATGKVIIPPKFRFISYIGSGVITLSKGDNKFAAFDETGRKLLPFEYRSIYSFRDGVAKLLKDEKWGAMDTQGNIIIPVQYDYIYDFVNGYAFIRHNEKYGIVDKTGKITTPIEFDYIEDVDKELVSIKKGKKWGLAEKSGQIIIPVQYDSVVSSTNGVTYVAYIEQNNKVGLVDRAGKIIVPPQYDDITRFSDGFAQIKQGEKSGLIDGNGKVILPPQYDDITRFIDGFAHIKQGEKLGLIDRDGKIVIPAKYDEVKNVADGLVRVQNNGKWGFIDLTGKVLIELEYQDADDFYEGKAKVSNGNDGKSPHYFYIDKKGNILTKRISLETFRQEISEGDNVYTADFGTGMILEIKGKLVQVQVTEEQCTQRDYNNNCKNYVKNTVGKWTKREHIYPSDF